MSDPSPVRTPSSVERMSSTTPKGAPAGMGGLLTILLVAACLALIVACFYISNGKSAIQTKLDQVTTKLNNSETAAADATSKLGSANRDVASLRAELDKRIPLFRLPAAVQAPSVNEAIAKIQQLSEGPKTVDAGSSKGSPSGGPVANVVAPTGDSPAAWMETIARQVAKASINTKQPAGNDPSKVQLNKGIQIVLARVGAFPKPPTGASQDTYDAVVAFQKANKLTADGVIGKGTWGKVREKLEATAHAGQ